MHSSISELAKDAAVKQSFSFPFIRRCFLKIASPINLIPVDYHSIDQLGFLHTSSPSSSLYKPSSLEYYATGFGRMIHIYDFTGIALVPEKLPYNHDIPCSGICHYNAQNQDI